MRLITYPSSTAFLRDNRSYLEAHEVANGLMLGLAIRLQDDPLHYGNTPPYMAAVLDDEGQPALCALMTPPHNLLLYSDRADARPAMAEVADDLRAGSWPVSGVNGPSALAEAFAELWANVTGERTQSAMLQRVYELRRVIPPRWSPGRLRQATPDDEELVLRWSRAFGQDAGVPGDEERQRANTPRRIADGEIYLWEDGRPVSMAARARPTQHGITVGMVYTPAELRGRGYATSCVAALSQQLLDAGYEYCTLFTDLANPTSNDIYQQIGYAPVCDFHLIHFVAGGRSQGIQL